MSDLVSELVNLMQLERLEENLFRGESRNIVGRRVFGGQVLGQALMAATGTVEGREAHSLQAYFIRPGDANAPIIYNVERVRDGGSFTTRRVAAIQHGRTIFDLSASFQVPEEGHDHQVDMPKAPAPEEVETEQTFFERFIREESPPEHIAKLLRRRALNPVEFRPIDPDHPLRPGKGEPLRQVWFRVKSAVPDDPALHRALLAYASDHGLLGAALRPHGLIFMHHRMQAASLDHTMWFHRPVRVDEWLLYSMESPSTSGARGLARGQIFTRDGVLVASTVQEGLMRVHPKT